MQIERPKSKQPIPKHAKKVFEGIMFDTYQWDQKMFDGSVEVFEKIKRPDTVIVFPIHNDGKIILTKQEQPGKEPFIGAAGGRIDPGEDIFNAAKRELLEETGYKAEKWKLWKSVQPISKIEWAVYIFIAKDIKKITKPSLDSGEKIELMSVNFEEFIKIALRDNFCEHEIYKEIVNAKLDPKKMENLRKILTNTL